MTKNDIVDTLCEKLDDVSKKEAAALVATLFDTIKDTLSGGETVKIAGFGNFVVRDKEARVGRNPQSGEKITISARRVVTFKASPSLKDAVNDAG
ncbi:MAG: integration host factor subunit alpha [Deltaproteobacteria bacterium]|nr:integration host factor subunit alpha [Deltaproteobacteria bacterium]